MTEKKKMIDATPDLKKEMALKFETSVRTVGAALNFETRSPFSRLLRKYAIEQGCKTYVIELKEVIE